MSVIYDAATDTSPMRDAMQRWDDGAITFRELVDLGTAYLMQPHLPMDVEPRPARPSAFDWLAPAQGQSWEQFDVERDVVLQALSLEERETGLVGSY